jgi:hypothetical protein
MAEKISAGVFPLYLAFFLAAMIIAMALLVKGLKKEREKI